MSKSATMNPSTDWKPSAAEIEAILVEMRPVIDRFVARDRRLMAACESNN